MGSISTPSKSTSSVSTDTGGYVRLHVTPFDQELLRLVIPSSVLPQARNISYHTVETFPEKRYGFVDLPTMDADKIKKRLNGAVLKGAKVRIQEAKPEAIPQPTEEVADAKTKKRKKDKKDKKRKREDNVIEGVELQDRKIKRGWTVSEKDMIKEKRKHKDRKGTEQDENQDKKKKKQQRNETKSKYTDQPECLFKQKLPSVPAAVEKATDASEGHRRKKRKSEREVVVHEFEKTTKYPSFLKSTVETSKSEFLTFEEGKGWVNSDGKVVEVTKGTRGPTLPMPISKRKKVTPQPETAAAVGDDDTTSSSGTSSDEDSDPDSSSEAGEDVEAPKEELAVDEQAIVSSPTSIKAQSSRRKSSASTASLSIKIPAVTPAATKVHPLEALYKRPQGEEGASPQTKSFSFFNEDDIEEEEEDTTMGPPSQIPMTPFTKKDFESRTTRSAAPTPDTAYPNRFVGAWPTSAPADDEQEEEEDDDDVPMGEAAAGSPAPATISKSEPREFEKLFYERRGDLNRAWKKRKKLSAKEKRNRENRSRAARMI
jgi:hypothetical protein